MSNTIIQVTNLSKSYTISHEGTERFTTLRDVMAQKAKKIFSFPRSFSPSHGGRRREVEEFWALKDVNFEIEQGDRVGVIGRNGAGKSTLLKILSRITEPTTGSVKIRGRVASLLEVGTGFHPELSGRENIFLNGAILGMSRAEIRRHFDAIVDFAEIEKFLDTPVKRYSSGMYVRLAFAVAAHLEPEILIVDEVLAVGDAEFQKKCLGKMRDVSEQGRTVLFVSHNMGAIRALCEKVMLMQYGKVDEKGDVNSVISKYLLNPNAVFTDSLNNETDLIKIKTVTFRNSNGFNTQNFSTAEDLVVEIKYLARQKFYKPYFWLSISSQHGSIFGASMLIDGQRPDFVEGEGVISCRFKKLPLMPQTYSIWLGVRDQGGKGILSQTKEVGFFNITSSLKLLGAAQGEHAETLANDSAPVIINYEWQLPNGEIIPVDFIN